MKTWILKGDLAHSPQTAFRTYACSIINVRPSVRISISTQDQGYFLISKIKSQLKSLSRLFDQGVTAGIERF